MTTLVNTLEQLGFSLPSYQPLPGHLPIVSYVRTGSTIHVSGQIPDVVGQEPLRGRLGAGLSVDNGREAARRAILNVLAVLDHAAGGLANVRRIIKVVGFVNSTPDFTDQPAVINAASELLVAIWGADNGKHARSAIGVAALPFDVPVEIELIAELEDRS
jgi:enamine deaminase RidA (YjgF/YER057c/UK114 family)